MSDDVLAKYSPEDVAAWYGRLADKVATMRVNGEEPLAALFLKHYLKQGQGRYSAVLQFVPPTHLRESPLVKETLDYHRSVYLTREKARFTGGAEKWAGIVPRLQGVSGFTKWDGYGVLEMQYNSLVELSMADAYGTNAEKDLFFALRGFQLHTNVKVQLETVDSDQWANFTTVVAWVTDRYDFDPKEHFTMPNPDYGSTDPEAIAPDSKNIRVYHTNAARMEKAGLAHPAKLVSYWWVPTFDSGKIEADKSLSSWW